MPRIVWDAVGEKFYETGVDHVVLYPQNETGEYTPGVPWNGVTTVTQSPEGAEPNDQYADNIKYLSILSAEDLGWSIEAFQSPPEFDACDGSAEVAPGVYIGQQDRKTFGVTYRTKIGNDMNQDYAYKINILYGSKASPSERASETINDSPEAQSLSWDCTTTPVPVTGHKPTASMTIRSDKVDPAKLKALEDILYGTDDAATPGAREGGTPARLPLPDEIIALLTGGGAEEVSMARERNMVRNNRVR